MELNACNGMQIMGYTNAVHCTNGPTHRFGPISADTRFRTTLCTTKAIRVSAVHLARAPSDPGKMHAQVDGGGSAKRPRNAGSISTLEPADSSVPEKPDMRRHRTVPTTHDPSYGGYAIISGFKVVLTPRSAGTCRKQRGIRASKSIEHPHSSTGARE